MSNQEVEFKILPDGTIDIDMLNYKGNACEAELKKLVKNIGVITANKKKQEYYEDDKEVHITE